MLARRGEPPLADDFVDGRHRARRAALDGKAHHAGTQRGDRETDARQHDFHRHFVLPANPSTPRAKGIPRATGS